MRRDAEIIDMLSSSDPLEVDRGLGMVYRDYGGLLKSTLRSLGASFEDSEDLLQEVLIAVMQRFQRSSEFDVSNLKFYLLGIARNKWMSELRSRRRLPFDEVNDYDLVDDAEPDTVQEEKIEVIGSILNAMSGPCRDLLKSFYYDKRTNSEIAELMGYNNTDTVKSKKYKCLQRLKDLVRERMNEKGR